MSLNVKIFISGCGRDKVIRQILRLGSEAKLYQRADVFEFSYWNNRYVKFKERYKKKFKSDEEFKQVYLERIKYERPNKLEISLNDDICTLLRIRYGKISIDSFVQYCEERFNTKNKNVKIEAAYYWTEKKSFVERPIQEVYEKIIVEKGTSKWQGFISV